SRTRRHQGDGDQVAGPDPRLAAIAVVRGVAADGDVEAGRCPVRRVAHLGMVAAANRVTARDRASNLRLIGIRMPGCGRSVGPIGGMMPVVAGMMRARGISGQRSKPKSGKGENSE